jgi:hypothetical protein
MTILNDPNLERLLDRLHERSDAQTSAIREHYDQRDKAVDRPPEDQSALTKTFLADKLYALDRDKAEFFLLRRFDPPNWRLSAVKAFWPAGSSRFK